MKKEFVRVEDIKIPNCFTEPSEKRIKKRIEYIKNGGDCTICLNKFNVLLDGYITLLALTEMGIHNIPVYRDNIGSMRRGKMTSFSNANLLDILYKKQNGCCYICGRQCNPVGSSGKDDLNPTIDHVVPKSKGGAKDITNTRMACSLCNCLKGNFTYSNALQEVITMELRERELL